MKSEGRAGLSVWGGGQLLAFSGLDGPTDFEHGVVARTAKDGRAAVEIMLPERALLVFGEAAPVEIDVTGDTLRARTGRGESRLVFADAHHLLVEGPCRVEGPDGGPMPEALRVAQSGDRTLVGTASAFEESWLDADAGGLWEDRRAWLATAVERVVGVGADGGSVPGRRGATLRKALSVMKTQVCTPEGLLRHRWTTPDRWPHRKIWLWDSGFHAAGWRHVDPPLAREMLSAVVDTQRPDGRIPISTDPFGRKTGAFTQPPVLALAVALVDEAAGDDEWLASVYEPLVRYVEWDLANRDSDGAGLVEWAIEGDPGCRSGESGADNSSRFDAATQLDAPDFNALLAHELEHLAAFADRLGRNEDVGRLRERHRALCARMNDRLWDEKTGIYMDALAATGERTGVLSAAGFLPLLCGAPSPRQAAKLVAHLREPATFGRPLPLPTIVANEYGAYSKDMWRGPAWVNVNWMVARGLRRYGYEAEARALVDRTMTVIEEQYARHGCIFEYYDDEDVVDPPRLLRKGSCDPEEWIHQSIHDYGWSATLYVDWAASGARG
ncbi:MAG: amylo-alpha-1,6-glucosidase [Spirochaetota bacterium]